MRNPETLSQKETIELINKCWVTHDGMWFFHCLQEFGIKKTNKLNKAAIRSLAPIELKRILNALDFREKIQSLDAFKDFFQAAAHFMIPDFMNATFEFSKENHMAWEFEQGKCFAYKGVKKLGVIDKYECGVLYRVQCWLDELGIEYRFNPEIDRCSMHYLGHCFGTIRLFL